MKETHTMKSAGSTNSARFNFSFTLGLLGLFLSSSICCAASFSKKTTAKPSIPTSIAASDNRYTNKVRVSWRKVQGANTYKVFRCLSSNVSKCGSGFTDSNPPYDDAQGTAGTKYFYRVKACNAGGCSGFSAYNTGIRKKVLPPAKPTKPNASDNDSDKIEISWNNVSGATSYDLKRCNGNNPCGSGFKASSPYVDTSVSPGIYYNYSVRACNVAGCSLYSYSDSGLRKYSPPAIPSKPNASENRTDTVRITWSSVSGAEFYQVSVCSVNGTSYSNSHCSNLANTYYPLTADIPATPGVTSYYRIRACKRNNFGGCSVFSEADAGRVRPPAPAKPQKPTASYKSFTDKIRVTWSAVSGVTDYYLLRCPSTSMNWCKPGFKASSPYDDSTVVSGRGYFYHIRACNAGVCSPYSAFATGMRKVLPPATPAKPNASDNSFTDKIRVTWPAVSGASKYWLRRCDEHNQCEPAIIASSPYDDTNTKMGIYYAYQVSACKTTACSTFGPSDAGMRKKTLSKVVFSVPLNVTNIHPDVQAIVPMCRIFKGAGTNANELGLDRTEVAVGFNRSVNKTVKVTITNNMHPGKSKDDVTYYTCTLYVKKSTQAGLYVYSTTSSDDSTRAVTTPVNVSYGNKTIDNAVLVNEAGKQILVLKIAAGQLSAKGIN